MLGRTLNPIIIRIPFTAFSSGTDKFKFIFDCVANKLDSRTIKYDLKM